MIFTLSILLQSSVYSRVIFNETVVFNGVEYRIIKKSPDKISIRNIHRTYPQMHPAFNFSGNVPVIVVLKSEKFQSIMKNTSNSLSEIGINIEKSIKNKYRKTRMSSNDEVRAGKLIAERSHRKDIVKEISEYDRMKSRVYSSMLSKIINARIHYRVKNRILEMNGTISGESYIFNAIYATVPADRIGELLRMPEVERVYPARRYRPLLDTSTKSIYAYTFWNHNYTGYPWDIAVVDTGIDSSHPALSGAIVEGRDFVPDDCDGNSTDDPVGHGTHIAGIIASRDSVYRGVAQGVGIINAKAYTDDSCNSGEGWFDDIDTMRGIEWAVLNSTHTAEIVSLSIGEFSPFGEDGLSRFVDAVVDSLKVVVVAAAGNCGPGGSPTDCPQGTGNGSIESPGVSYNAITVGAMDDRDTPDRGDDIIADYSSRGPVPHSSRIKPDLVAPGSYITSTSSTWESSSKFVTMSGTSMATPHVAAAAALIMSAGVFDPKEIKALLINTAQDLGEAGGDYTYGWGYINLSHAYYHIPDVRLGRLNSSVRYLLYTGNMSPRERATLVWNRHVNYTGASYPSAYYTLSDLDLYLYDENTGKLLNSSVSPDENVEQVISPSNTTVVVKVEVFSFAAGISQEEFALATEEGFNLASPPNLSVKINTQKLITPGKKFNITAQVENTGDVAAHNVSVALSLPPGFSIVEGENPQNIGSIPAGSSATAIWTLSTSASEGNYTISAVVTSNSYDENYSASTSEILSVDATPPEIFIYFPENTTYTSTDLYLNVSASENTTAWWYSLNNGANTTFTPNTTITAAEGLNHLIVYARDAAGNVGRAERYFSIDTLPPRIVIYSPINGSTNTDIFNITFSEVVSWAAYSVDGGKNITIANVSNWSGILSNLTDGHHNITVYANDSFGHFNFTIRFWTRDTSPPSIILYSPENTTYSSNNITLKVSADEKIAKWWYNLNGINSTFTPNTTITASEGFNRLVIYARDAAGNTGYRVQYFTVDTTPPAIRIISPRNKSYSTGEIDYILTSEEALNWSVVNVDGINITLRKLNGTYFYNLSSQHQNLTEGFHNATFYARDLAGNFNSSTVYFTVDTTPPSVSFTSPTPPNGSISTANSITINVTHTELYPDTLILNWNGTNFSQAYSGNYTSLTFYNLSDGRYSYYIWVNDTAGNANATEVRMITIDTSPPMLLSITPLNGSGVRGVVAISVIARDRGTGVASVVALVKNTTYLQVLNLTHKGSDVWYAEWNTSPVAEGEYTITINATDFSGRSNSSKTTVVVDRTPPFSLLTSPEQEENISTSSYTITGIASDNESGISRVWVSMDGGSSWFIAKGTINWSYHWNITKDGEYNITCKAEDRAGNNQTSLRYIRVTVDTTPPQLILLPPTPASGSTLSSGTATINISIIETHPDTLILNWNGKNESFNYTGGYTSITKDISSGSYSFYIWANDTFGNINTTQVITFSVASQRSTTFTTGGGGGAASPSYKVEISKAEKGSIARLSLEPERAGGIFEIQLKPKMSLYNARLRVETPAKLPSYIKPPDGEIYSYVKLTFSTLAVEQVKIKFRVPVSWLKERNVSPATVRLLRYEKSVWKELNTQIINRTRDYVVYQAISPGLSYFAVVGEPDSGYYAERAEDKVETKFSFPSVVIPEKTGISKAEKPEVKKEPEEIVKKPLQTPTPAQAPRRSTGICGPSVVLASGIFAAIVMRKSSIL